MYCSSKHEPSSTYIHIFNILYGCLKRFMFSFPVSTTRASQTPTVFLLLLLLFLLFEPLLALIPRQRSANNIANNEYCKEQFSALPIIYVHLHHTDTSIHLCIYCRLHKIKANSYITWTLHYHHLTVYSFKTVRVYVSTWCKSCNMVWSRWVSLLRSSYKYDSLYQI